MAVKRRLGSQKSKNRELLIDAAAMILREHGYSELKAKKIAETAGLKAQLVYYYFESIDDVILAVLQRNISERFKRFIEALDSSDPIRGIWEMNSDPAFAIAGTEMTAIANHREAIRPEIVSVSKQTRTLQIEALKKIFAERGIDQKKFPAAGVLAIGSALARAMAQDHTLGVDEGYDEAMQIVEMAIEYLASTSSGKASKIPPEKIQDEAI